MWSKSGIWEGLRISLINIYTHQFLKNPQPVTKLKIKKQNQCVLNHHQSRENSAVKAFKQNKIISSISQKKLKKMACTTASSK